MNKKKQKKNTKKSLSDFIVDSNNSKRTKKYEKNSRRIRVSIETFEEVNKIYKEYHLRSLHQAIQFLIKNFHPHLEDNSTDLSQIPILPQPFCSFSQTPSPIKHKSLYSPLFKNEDNFPNFSQPCIDLTSNSSKMTENVEKIKQDNSIIIGNVHIQNIEVDENSNNNSNNNNNNNRNPSRLSSLISSCPQISHQKMNQMKENLNLPQFPQSQPISFQDSLQNVYSISTKTQETSTYEQNDPSTNSVFISQRSSLEQLMKRCPVCGREIIKLEGPKIKGSVIKYILHCSHHKTRWVNSNIVNKKYLLNWFFPSSFLLVGGNFNQFEQFCYLLHIPCPSRSYYFKTIQENLITAIKSTYEEKQEQILQELNGRRDLMTDGRYNRSIKKGQGQALFCTTSMMDRETKKIVAVDTMKEIDKIPNMGSREGQSVRKMLNFLIDKIEIRSLTSDGEKSVAKVMEEFLEIKHFLCRTHKQKGLVKQFDKAFVDDPKINSLSHQVITHFQICSQVSRSVDEFLLRWINFVYHISGDHDICAQFNPQSKCTQPNYQETNQLTEEDLLKLSIWMDNVTNDKSIEQYIGGFDTSWVESFNSSILTYCPKNISYQKSFSARILLAVMHWNENTSHREHPTFQFRETILKKFFELMK